MNAVPWKITFTGPRGPGGGVTTDLQALADEVEANTIAAGSSAAQAQIAQAAAETAAQSIEGTQEAVEAVQALVAADRLAAEQAAADAAQVLADAIAYALTHPYANQAAGHAAVSVGELYAVGGDVDSMTFMTLWEKGSGGVGTDIQWASAPSALAITEMQFGESGPALGFAGGDTQAAVAQVDADGKPVLVWDKQGTPRRAAANGLWASGVTQTRGPAIGWLPGRSKPVTLADVDFSGRPMEASPVGAAIGWASDDPDSRLASLLADQGGRLLLGFGKGNSAHTGKVFFPLAGDKVGSAEVFGPHESIHVLGDTALLPPVRVALGSNIIDVPAYEVTSPAPASASITDTLNIVYNDDNWLTYLTPRSVSVVTNPGGVAKTEGVDYRVSDRGAIRGLINTAAHLIDISYTGHKTRIDYVVINSLTGAVSLRQGTEKNRNAAFFPPALTANDIVIWRLFRYVDGFIAQPRYLFDGRVRRDNPARTEASIAKCRRRLGRFFRRKASASTLKIGSYGDSITQMGAGPPVDVNTTAGGIYRDQKSYYAVVEATALATITAYDFGDGAGTVHTKTGWSWAVVNYLAALGITVTYRNRGIGGTTSESTTNGSGYANGLQADRLAAAVADACDLMLIAFGMNELGSTTTYANLCTMTAAFLAAGTDVILITPARPHPFWPSANQPDEWRFTCAEIIRAADGMGVAYADTSRLFDPRNLAALGLTEYELANAVPKNHPGVQEMAAIGELLLELVA